MEKKGREEEDMYEIPLFFQCNLLLVVNKGQSKIPMLCETVYHVIC